MPAKKKETKQEGPAYVDEVGTFVHEQECARYRGGVRRFCLPNEQQQAAGSGGGGSKGGKGVAATSPAPAEDMTAHANAARYRHGHGTYLSPAIKYVGDWVEDEMHGHGHLEFLSSGHVYDGDFCYGRFQGHGVYQWKDGSRYEGNWVDSKMHGEGVYTDAEGHVWKGKYYSGSGPGLQQLCSSAVEEREGLGSCEKKVVLVEDVSVQVSVDAFLSLSFSPSFSTFSIVLWRLFWYVCDNSSTKTTTKKKTTTTVFCEFFFRFVFDSEINPQQKKVYQPCCTPPSFFFLFLFLFYIFFFVVVVIRLLPVSPSCWFGFSTYLSLRSVLDQETKEAQLTSTALFLLLL
eukprot:gene10916-7574_t